MEEEVALPVVGTTTAKNLGQSKVLPLVHLETEVIPVQHEVKSVASSSKVVPLKLLDPKGVKLFARWTHIEAKAQNLALRLVVKKE